MKLLDWVNLVDNSNGSSTRKLFKRYKKDLKEKKKHLKEKHEKLQKMFSARKLEGRLKWHGLDVSIETAKGSIRQGIGKDGVPWRVRMTWPYGYLKLTQGVDGDHVDCFIGPDKDAEFVYIIHTKEPTTNSYDEDKACLDFSSADAAKKAFLDNYSSSDFFGGMTVLPVDEFIKKVKATKSKPQKIHAGMSCIARVQ